MIARNSTFCLVALENQKKLSLFLWTIFACDLLFLRKSWSLLYLSLFYSKLPLGHPLLFWSALDISCVWWTLLLEIWVMEGVSSSKEQTNESRILTIYVPCTSLFPCTAQLQMLLLSLAVYPHLLLFFLEKVSIA